MAGEKKREISGEEISRICSDGAAADGRLMRAAPYLLDALKSVLPILDATRFSTGLGKNQLERIKKAKAAVAMAESKP